MEQNKKRKRRYIKQQAVKIEHPGRPAGLAKTRKIQRTERDREIQFLKLCSQIRLEDFKKDRAENQRNSRRLKR